MNPQYMMINLKTLLNLLKLFFGKPEIKYQEFFETEFKSVWYIGKKENNFTKKCTINFQF